MQDVFVLKKISVQVPSALHSGQMWSDLKQRWKIIDDGFLKRSCDLPIGNANYLRNIIIYCIPTVLFLYCFLTAQPNLLFKVLNILPSCKISSLCQLIAFMILFFLFNAIILVFLQWNNGLALILYQVTLLEKFRTVWHFSRIDRWPSCYKYSFSKNNFFLTNLALTKQIYRSLFFLFCFYLNKQKVTKKDDLVCYICWHKKKQAYLTGISVNKGRNMRFIQ